MVHSSNTHPRICSSFTTHIIYKYNVHHYYTIALLIIAIGTGGIKSSVSAFVGDQFVKGQVNWFCCRVNGMYCIAVYVSFLGSMITSISVFVSCPIMSLWCCAMILSFDNCDGIQEDKLNNVFFIFYFSINFGSFISTIITPIVREDGTL